jgi:hypothetical protein
MKLAKAKVDLTWLQKPEYEILLAIWQEHHDGYAHAYYPGEEKNSYGFRHNYHRDKGRGLTTQHIRFIVCQEDKKLRVEIFNPSTYNDSVAMLPLDNLPASPRQFQKLVFASAQGHGDTLSAGKTNLREAWAEFLAAIEKMPFIEHYELHTDNSEEGYLE